MEGATEKLCESLLCWGNAVDWFWSVNSISIPVVDLKDSLLHLMVYAGHSSGRKYAEAHGF